MAKAHLAISQCCAARPGPAEGCVPGFAEGRWARHASRVPSLVAPGNTHSISQQS